MNRLIILGASGHGKVCANIAKLSGYSNIVFLDDDDIEECAGYPVIGRTTDAEALGRKQPTDFFVAIGNSRIREKKMIQLENCHIITLIHPKSVIAEDVQIGFGSVVMAGAVINPGTVIGNGCIINTSATVDHDNSISSYDHISVGACLAGTVTIGEHTWVGAGAVIRNNVTVCGDVLLGMGAVVVKNIETPGIYIGVPAKKRA